MNIIIPAAGLGRRFAEDGYLYPKPLISVLGEPMIVRVLKSLKLSETDRITIVYTQELEKYLFRSVLRKACYELELNFVLLNFNTRGPAETVLCGLNKMSEIEDSVLVIDCDTFYGDDVVELARAQGGNCIFYFEDHSMQALFSYITIDGMNRVGEIKEKVKISRYACSGAYAFKSGTVLKRYCELVLDSESKSNNEYYISNVYEQMLRHGEAVGACRVEDFTCLGTPQQLKAYCMSNDSGPRRFCFDLDGTLVTFPEEKNDYKTVKPIPQNIRFLRSLHEQGHTIIIQTARNMLSSAHNPGRATRRAYEEVADTLEKYDIPFDEIYFGKPFADFYIDDKAVKPFDAERETGFYDGRIEARYFNQIEYEGDTVVKITSNPGELYWYEHIPEAIREHFPRAVVAGRVLRMERIEGIVFSYLLVNSSLTKQNIARLLEVVEKMHSCQRGPDRDVDFNANYNAKMAKRYAEFDYGSVSIHAEHYLTKISKRLLGHVPLIGVIHGDLVFSNIFLCDNQLIRFIDMRGNVDGVETIFGDIFYDYAKIYQSLLGYDFILNEREINTGYLAELRTYFEEAFTARFSSEQLEELKYLTASLLFSLIPLHKDPEKQKKYFELIRECV